MKIRFVPGLAVLPLVFALASPMAAQADLVVRDLLEPGDGLITLDTSTGLEWLDLTRTTGLSIDAVRIDFGGLTGGRIATEEEVIGLFSSAGVVDIGGTCVENEPGVTRLLEFMGITFVEVSGGLGSLALHDGGALDLGIATRARLRVGPQIEPLATADPDIDLVSTHAEFDDTGIFVVRAVAVPAPPAAERLTARLRVSPNPFNPSTEIRFFMPESGLVEITIYDARGRSVRVLERSRRGPGQQAVLWDGRDGSGHGLASGSYFVRLSSPVFTSPEVTRAVLVR